MEIMLDDTKQKKKPMKHFLCRSLQHTPSLRPVPAHVQKAQSQQHQA
jgi:hypothetical protein